MRVRSKAGLFLCSVGLMVTMGVATRAGAQAENTAQRLADLLVFGGYAYTSPDYGPQHNNGFTLGADYDRLFGWRAIPGFEFRANFNSGQTVKEHTYIAGPRLHVNLARRFHPYGDFLVGLGAITYPIPVGTINDSGLAYSGGGGVDIDVAHNVMLKADYQSQSWNLGRMDM